MYRPGVSTKSCSTISSTFTERQKRARPRMSGLAVHAVLSPHVNGVAILLDVLIIKEAVHAGFHATHLAGIAEVHFAPPITAIVCLVLSQEP